MHTHTGKFGTIFHHNADMTGGIEIVTPNGSVKVQWGDILTFVGEYVRRRQIEKIEEMSVIDVLGLSRGPWD